MTNKRHGSDFYVDRRIERLEQIHLLNQFLKAPRPQSIEQTFFTQADFRAAYRRFTDAQRRKAEGRKPLNALPISPAA